MSGVPERIDTARKLSLVGRGACRNLMGCESARGFDADRRYTLLIGNGVWGHDAVPIHIRGLNERSVAMSIELRLLA